MYFFEMESRVGVNLRRQLIVCQYCLRKANPLSWTIIILTIDCVFQFLLLPCCTLPRTPQYIFPEAASICPIS